MKTDEFANRLWTLAARVGKLVDAIPKRRLGKIVADRLARCGLAFAPSYDDADTSASIEDRARLLAVATRELRETRRWLQISTRVGLLPAARVNRIVKQSDALIETLTRKARTAAKRIRDRPAPVAGPRAAIGPGWTGLDHLAIAVSDTEEALRLWRDRFGLPVLDSEDVNGGTVRLTHLDLGNTQLQLVEPLVADHPLRAWLEQHGAGLHHFCLGVEDIDEAMRRAPVPTASKPHQGTRGKRALFLDKTATDGVQVELTGP
jgi:methylmalonyl-CoA/ethylmalonyl-CoA epimerase